MSGYYQTDRNVNEKLLAFKNKNIHAVFHYLSSQARFKQSEYYGIKIERGQIAINYEKISKVLKLTIAQVIYAIRILKKNKIINAVVNSIRGIKTLIISVFTDAFNGVNKHLNLCNNNNLQQKEKTPKKPVFTDAHKYDNMKNNVNVNNISIPNKDNNISYIAKPENQEKFEKFDRRWKEISDYALENTKYTYSTEKYENSFWNYIKKYEIPLNNIFKLYEGIVKNNIYIASINLSKYYRHVKAFCSLDINPWNAYEAIKKLIKMKRIHTADDFLHLIENPAKFKQLNVLKG